MKIICLHHAGGSSFLYSGWEKMLLGNIVVSFDLPGHGKKMAQKPLEKYKEAIEYLYDNICKEINDTYIIFGHSMGAEMLLHIMEKIEYEGKKLPQSIILSGLSSKNAVIPASSLSDDELLEKISEFGGIQDEMLKTKEFIDYFFPIIRADFNMIEATPEYKISGNKKYEIHIFNGLEDISAINAEKEWKEFFDDKCKIHHFKGNHFYLLNNSEEVCKEILSLI